MRIRDLKPGDRVTVRWNGITGFTTVTEVGKRKIKTADGGEWKTSGYRWGSDEYYGPHIDRYEPADDKQLAEQREEQGRRRLAHELHEVPWRDLPLSVLQAVKALVAPEQPAQEQTR